MVKTVSVRLSIKKYELLKMLVKIKDTSFNDYINDLITKDLKLNIHMIKKYKEVLKWKE